MKKQIPILFSAAMVQAILAGRKTMTRRVVKGIALDWLEKDGFTPEFVADPDNGLCRYGKVGDVLWVRENFRKYILFDPTDENLKTDEIIDFAADGEEPIPMIDGDGFQMFKKDGSEKFIPYRPSIHMPKKAARIWLEVVSIRVERAHDISEADAISEGIESYTEEGRPRYKDYMADASGYGDPAHDYPSVGIAVTSFATLWEKINGRESWEANPWVWVVEFKVLSTTGKPELN